MDCLLKEAKLSQKFAKIVEGECNIAVQKLNLFGNQLVTKKEMVDTVEASLVVTFACPDKIIENHAELHYLLAEVQGQRVKDLAGVQAVLGEDEARAAKAEKAW